MIGLKTASMQFCNLSMLPSDALSNTAKDLQEGHCCKWHFVWLVPMNVLANWTAITLAPLAFFCHLVAAAVFAIMSACESDPDKKLQYKLIANMHLACSISSFTDGIVTAFIRIGLMTSGPITDVGKRVFDKLSDCQSGSFESVERAENMLIDQLAIAPEGNGYFLYQFTKHHFVEFEENTSESSQISNETTISLLETPSKQES